MDSCDSKTLPKHPLEAPAYLEDDATSFPIPKTLTNNLAVRESLLQATRTDETQQKQVMELCSESILLWVNLFAWTYNVKVVDDYGREIPAQVQHVPFITWPVQDEAITNMINGIDRGYDLLIDKSRDMGASWICITVAVWMWLFRDNTQALLVSRVARATLIPCSGK